MTPTEEPSLICNSILQIQPTTIDEPSETIEADFTDSVSLILHQLQQDEKPDFLHSRGSLTISEGSTNDDGDDENDDNISDDCDNESIPGSSISERIQIIRRSLSIHESTKSVQTDLSFDINDNMLIMKNTSLESTSLSNSNKSLTDSSTSINKLKMNSTYNKSVSSNKRLSIPTSISTIKKDSERKGSITVINTASSTRKLSLIPSKKGSPAMTRQNSINSIVSSSSQSKLNHSLSSTTSIDDNHTEVIPNSRRSSNTNLKSSSTTTRKVSHPTNLLDSDKKTISSQHLSLQKSVIQSFEDQSRKQYQYLLKQFDTLCIMSQYYHSQNEQIKQHYELQLKKVQTASNQLKISIDQLQTSHQNELSTLEQQHRNQLDTIKELHQQQIIEYQQNLDKASNEKIEFEIRCKSLQEQVDRFMDEMANSEHADPLLRRVEILEKDRTSLQTVLEIRKQELTQLRTKINEQVFQREDQLALQKRIDMVENRNQDLVCLLRNWQLNEKAIAVERDQLKEQIAILERDNRQLTFQNETLLYRLRDRPISTSQPQSLKLNLTAPIIPPSRDRTHSLSTLMITNIHKTDCLSRSLSLNFL
ncbi:hypothetical protein I4U23_019608 [Adineta vaga]|nr:hypothetical protein I4U23_019608 [Adineta vaga]